MNLLFVFAFAGFLTSCVSYKEIPITSNPSGADVYYDNNHIGVTPTSVRIGDDVSRSFRAEGKKEGYFSDSTSVNYSSSAVHLILESVLKRVNFNSTVPNVSVEIDGVKIGETPMSYEFNFRSRSKSYKIDYRKVGYCDEQSTLNFTSKGIRNGAVDVNLKVNQLWLATDWSEAANKWMRVSVDPSITFEDTWQKVVDSVTSVYDRLDQLDPDSGYFRSTPHVREFVGCSADPVYVRTQLIGTVSSRDPLVYKFKLDSTTKNKSQHDELAWQDFERVFRSDALLVEELTNRLGIK